jgi:hypothetical protein
MMLPSVREYVEAANRAHQCAQSEQNPHAKQILQEIERSYCRLVEIGKWMVDQQQYTDDKTWRRLGSRFVR